MLDKNVDAVAIFTDGPLHVQHAVEAMRHGKHVISAVPAAWATLDQCHLLQDTVRKGDDQQYDGEEGRERLKGLVREVYGLNI